VDHWGVTPDILVTAKGLSSGYAPLGAVIIAHNVVDAIATGTGSFIHGFTYSSHPISLAAGNAVLAHIKRTNLVQAADSDREGSTAHQLKAALAGLRSLPAVGDVRGIGLLWAVEFVSDQTSKSPFPSSINFAALVAQAAVDRGLLVYPVQGCADGDCGDHILIAPPAIISPDQIAWAVEQLGAAIAEASARP
jgi:hypothetical protein